MVILGIASILAVALVLERFLYFWRNRFSPSKGLAEYRRLLSTTGREDAIKWSKTQKNPLGRMFMASLEDFSMTGEELADRLISVIGDERLKFERLLGGMGTLANAATLLGLLGTVTGLIRAFGNIAATGSGGPAVVSAGISEALVCTAFGLFIGIPTLFFANYFAKKAADTSHTLEHAAERIVFMLGRVKQGVKLTVGDEEKTARKAS
jgi:biopolymer transport protein ExbB